MGRIAKGEPPYGLTQIYTPKAYGNRDEADPVRIHYSLPTEAQRRTAMVGLDVASEGWDISGNQGKLFEQLCAICVNHVESYSRRGNVEAGEKEIVPIRSAAEFAEFGETPFLVEMGMEIYLGTSLSKDESKNSEGSPDTSQAVTQVSDGTAASAGEKA